MRRILGSEVCLVKLSDRTTNLQPLGHWNTEKIERYREEGKKILQELGSAYAYYGNGEIKKLYVIPIKQ